MVNRIILISNFHDQMHVQIRDLNKAIALRCKYTRVVYKAKNYKKW